MNTQMRIAEPCHEDWDAMIPDITGRHCAQCCKTVVDFTDWDTEDILSYLQQNNNTCGRLRADQMAALPEGSHLEVIPVIAASTLPYWKKIAATVALLFVFASGSYGQNKSAKQVPAPATIEQSDTLRPMVMGKIVCPKPNPEHNPKPVKDTVVPKPVPVIQGMIALPETPVKAPSKVKPKAKTGSIKKK